MARTFLGSGNLKEASGKSLAGREVENGIVSGMDNNPLAPQGDATRAQVAQIMMNFCDWII